tara:strand:+ start:1309 stop:1509 length:201 start_codon:yes stop_codon:yes gene_type:complete
MDSNKRSVAKAISFRILATILTLVLVIYFTGNWAIASAIGASDFISKLVLYYAHERSWEKVSWGKS